MDADAEAATWIDETVVPRPKNIYGATKCAAEDLCELVHRERGLPVVVLLTSRFFPEPDDVPKRAAAFDDLNLQVVELLHRRVDLEDLVSAHAAALSRAPALGFGRFIASATSPFHPADARQLMTDAPEVIHRRYAPQTAEVFDVLGWKLPASIDRVYDNTRARKQLGWEPRFTFDHAVTRLAGGAPPFSDVTRVVGAKGYGERAVP